MVTRAQKKLIWWVLPLLMLRSLVPSGFMLDTSHGRVSMAFCPGVMNVASMRVESVASSHAGSAHHEHHPNPKSQHEGGGHTSTICLFATAAAAPIPSLLAVSVDAVTHDGTRADDVDTFHSAFGPSRTQQSRAPPTLS